MAQLEEGPTPKNSVQLGGPTHQLQVNPSLCVESRVERTSPLDSLVDKGLVDHPPSSQTSDGSRHVSAETGGRGTFLPSYCDYLSMSKRA